RATNSTNTLTAMIWIGSNGSQRPCSPRNTGGKADTSAITITSPHRSWRTPHQASSPHVDPASSAIAAAGQADVATEPRGRVRPMSATGTDLRTRFHPESEFGGFTDIDGTIPFFLRARELLPSEGVALDIGCGRGTQDDDPVRVRRELRI